MTKRQLLGLFLIASLASCGSETTVSGDSNTPPDALDGTGNPPGTNPGGSNNGNPGPGNTPNDPSQNPSCAQVSAEAKVTVKPVDVIIIIDTSESMYAEIAAVEKNINQNFAQIIGASGLDYRVILLARHGKSSEGGICVSPPLGGNPDCKNPGTKPVNTSNFFHFNQYVYSRDSLQLALSTYDRNGGGWRTWLRDDAYKAFIEITDDDSDMKAEDFDRELLKKSAVHFGTSADRNYVFHTIAGLRENTPATLAWEPTDPLLTTKCTKGGTQGAVNPGTEYQKLSRLTGGLRFPICEYDAFDAVFQRVATGVVQGAQVACEFEVPTPPAGMTIGSSKVEYTPGAGGATQTFKPVVGSGACSDDAYFVDDSKVQLCPTTCAKVKGDKSAKLSIVFTCDTPIF